MKVASITLLTALVLSPMTMSRVLHVDSTAPPGGDGSTWGGAFVDLQSALQLARTDPTIDQIWVAAGTYRPDSGSLDRRRTFRLIPGVSLYGGFDGTEANIEDRDPGANVTILSGDLRGDDLPGFVGYADNSFHVVTANDPGLDPSSVLDGFSIRGGHANDSSDRIGTRGGGLQLRVGSLSLNNLVFELNLTSGSNDGGALYADFDTVVSIRSCKFESNVGGNSGHIFAEGASIDIDDSKFIDGDNSGIAIYTNGEITLTGCLFEDNFGTQGGGLTAFGGVTLTVRECSFIDNEATTGGGIGISTDCELLVEDSFFGGNRVTAGGGMFIVDSHAVVRRTRFEANEAIPQGQGAGGGGIAVLDDFYWPSLEVENCVFAESALGHLRVISNTLISVKKTTFVNETISDDTVDLERGGAAHLHECIVWGTNTSPIDSAATVTYSCVRGGFPGQGNISQDPSFVDLPGGDLRLRNDSPCIDRGDALTGPGGQDLWGDPRFLDGDLDSTLVGDMGADEFAPLNLSVSGTPSAGATITIETSGTPGLSLLLIAATDVGEVFLPGAGSLFVGFSTPWLVLPFGTSPGSTDIDVPIGTPPGVTVRLQEIGSTGIAATTTNPWDLLTQ